MMALLLFRFIIICDTGREERPQLRADTCSASFMSEWLLRNIREEILLENDLRRRNHVSDADLESVADQRKGKQSGSARRGRSKDALHSDIYIIFSLE